MTSRRTGHAATRSLLVLVTGLVVALLSSLVLARTGKPVVEIRRSSVPGSSTVRIRNALMQPYFSAKQLGRSRSWVSFRSSDLRVRVPRGLADKLAAAARSGKLEVTTGVGDWGHGLLRVAAGEGSSRVVLQRTRFSIGSEALQVQLGAKSRPFWLARASVKANRGPGKIHGASGVSRGGDVTLLDPVTLEADLKPAQLGELRWFAKPARRAALLQPFLAPEQWRRATVPARLGPSSPTRKPAPAKVGERGPRPEGQPVATSSGRGAMKPTAFDPMALLRRKQLDPAQLKLVPALGKSTSGLQIYYQGRPIGYYSRDATHRSMQLAEEFHGKGIGTIAYLVMAKLFHDAGRGLLTSDVAQEGGGGNLSPQAQAVWRRFVSGGYAEASTSGQRTVYRMKQRAIDTVSWDRFTPLLADRAPRAGR